MSKHPVFKLSSGLLMGVVGLGMLISSGVLLAQNMNTVMTYLEGSVSHNDIAQMPTTPASTCVQQLSLMGFSATTNDRFSVTVSPEGIADTEMPVELASAAASACNGYTLSHFCMGADCEGGLEMELETLAEDDAR